jgi:transposase-like protein
MQKKTALALLGGDVSSVARHVGCTRQSVHKWPELLPRRIADRVLAARLRLEWEIARAQPSEPLNLSPVVADALSV